MIGRVRSKADVQTESEAGEKAPEEWREWLETLFPSHVGAPFAPRMERFWEWAWAIEADDDPRPYVAPWPRGGGKSSTPELATCALGLRGVSDFAVYVRATQDLADDSVSNIQSMLESNTVERYYPAHAQPEMGKFGNVRGWRRERLRTEGGFTVDALGLDAAARGAKIEESRPDVLLLDDLDQRHDSRTQTQKKLKTLKDSVIPMLSDSGSVVIYIQNLINPNSICAQLVDGRADFLQTRIVDGPHPAIEGLQTTKQKNPETGEYRDVIVEGTPTWAGQDLSDCQARIDRSGLASFIRECQNDVSEREGALWSTECLNAVRAGTQPDALQRIVVGADPSGGTDEIGIIIAGKGPGGTAYVLDDRSQPGAKGPNNWGQAARDAYDDWAADCVVVEANFGGDLVTANVRGATERHINVQEVHASRGKQIRAEPVASLYGSEDAVWDDSQVRHAGTFSELESQMTSWVPGDADSPDRLDALVWALTELILEGGSGQVATSATAHRRGPSSVCKKRRHLFNR